MASRRNRLRHRCVFNIHVPAQMLSGLHCVAFDSGIDPRLRRHRRRLLLQRGSRWIPKQFGFPGAASLGWEHRQYSVLCHLRLYLLRYFRLPAPDDDLLLQQNPTGSRRLQSCGPVHNPCVPNNVPANLFGHHTRRHVGGLSLVHDLLAFFH